MIVNKERIVCAALGLGVLLLIAGCETVKGTACGVGATVNGAASGVVKDAHNAGSFLERSDAWVRKNLW